MFDANGIARIAEQKIQEAIEEGKFDNLPGKGKPLVFDDDLVTPPEMRMASKILKNANVLPDWIQIQRDIEEERKEIAALRARLARENQARRARIAGLAESHPQVIQHVEWYAKGRTGYLRKLKGVNTSILKFCMMAPSTAQPLIPYRIDAEMEQFDADVPAPDVQIAPPPVPEERPSKLRSLARLRYAERGGRLPDLHKGSPLSQPSRHAEDSTDGGNRKP